LRADYVFEGLAGDGVDVDAFRGGENAEAADRWEICVALGCSCEDGCEERLTSSDGAGEVHFDFELLEGNVGV
jgi:hypothetical protein